MEKEPNNQPDSNYGLGVRHSQILLYFMALSAVYALRMNLSLAVVAMTTSTTNSVPLSPAEKALVLTSLFWGYGLLQPYLGNLGRRTNAVRVLSYCILISAVLSLATPLAAVYFGAVGIIVVRLVMGITQGGVYPNLTNLLSMWAVPREKEIMIAFVFNGTAFGTFVAMASSGVLAARFGWPSVFYSTAILGIVVGGAVLYFGKCSPSDHKGISKEEQEFMRNSLGDKNIETMRKLKVPWKSILTSVPVLSLTTAHWCNSWGYWTLSTLTPMYMNGVLNFDIENDGFLSALSPLTYMLLSFLFTAISVKIRNLMPPLYAKFMWNSIGMYGSAIALVLLAYTRDTTIAIILITAGSGISVATNFGFQTNHIDLSPNFAGVLYSLTNSVANFASIFGPLISTYLIKDNSNLYEWRIVFLMSGAIFVLGNTCFLFWGSGQLQEWNKGKTKATMIEA